MIHEIDVHRRDLRKQVEVDVRGALLDLGSAQQQIDASRENQRLARAGSRAGARAFSRRRGWKRRRRDGVVHVEPGAHRFDRRADRIPKRARLARPRPRHRLTDSLNTLSETIMATAVKQDAAQQQTNGNLAPAPDVEESAGSRRWILLRLVAVLVVLGLIVGISAMELRPSPRVHGRCRHRRPPRARARQGQRLRPVRPRERQRAREGGLAPRSDRS